MHEKVLMSSNQHCHYTAQVGYRRIPQSATYLLIFFNKKLDTSFKTYFFKNIFHQKLLQTKDIMGEPILYCHTCDIARQDIYRRIRQKIFQISS